MEGNHRYAKVNLTMMKSRNPTEHGIRINQEIGKIVQIVGDGYIRLRFDKFKIR